MAWRALLLALLAVSAGCVGAVPDPGDGSGAGDGSAESRTATVVSVTDGDTVEVEFADGERETVRLVGVDTPEVHVPTSPEEFGYENTSESRAWLRDRGHEASEFARTELEGEDVTVSTDAEEGPRDPYGRLLAYVRHDGELFNERLLRRGYARLYDTEFEHRDAFADAEAAARDEGLGVWGYAGERTTAIDAPVGDAGQSHRVPAFRRGPTARVQTGTNGGLRAV